MSDSERTALLLNRVKQGLAKSREITPERRFQKMVDAGLISPDGELRRDDSPQAVTTIPAANKK
jgi:hypothetical protein